MERLDSTSKIIVTLLAFASAALVAGECLKNDNADNMKPGQEQRASNQAGESTGESGPEEKATFAAGCFWGVEAAFRQIRGVVSTAVGYTGGNLENPTYEQVCTGKTGHAEAVEVTYDPAQVSYDQILEVFWKIHDPTTLNRQGPDIGSQYRSAIFYHTPQQRSAAKHSRKDLEKSGRFKKPIVTEIAPASSFYRAEEYHQRYLEKHGKTSWALP
jgi:peptide-methionine (S)-S-oxide reductase